MNGHLASGRPQEKLPHKRRGAVYCAPFGPGTIFRMKIVDLLRKRWAEHWGTLFLWGFIVAAMVFIADAVFFAIYTLIHGQL